MHRLVFFFLVAALLLLTAGWLGNGTTAQGIPIEDLETCGAGRTPTAGEADILNEIEGHDYQAWEGVCEPIPRDQTITLDNVDQLEVSDQLKSDLKAILEQNQDFVIRPYDVAFRQEWSATRPIRPNEGLPEEVQAELMVVVVREGEFALDLLRESPSGATVTAQSEAGIGSASEWDGTTDPPHYEVLGPNEACAPTCEVTPGEPVVLSAGDYAITEPGAFCIYCLLRNAAFTDDLYGILDVYVVMDPNAEADSFSWIQSWRLAQILPATPEARITDPPTRFAWALFATGFKDH